MSALIERTLEIADEFKRAMGGRTSDPINPNYLIAAASIALAEADGSASTQVVNVVPTSGAAEDLADSYRNGYLAALEWMASNFDLDTLDRDRLDKIIEGTRAGDAPE